LIAIADTKSGEHDKRRAPLNLDQREYAMSTFKRLFQSGIRGGGAAVIAYATTTTQTGGNVKVNTALMYFLIGFISGLGLKSSSIMDEKTGVTKALNGTRPL
jgi:hypothetical protein